MRVRVSSSFYFDKNTGKERKHHKNAQESKLKSQLEWGSRNWKNKQNERHGKIK